MTNAQILLRLVRARACRLAAWMDAQWRLGQTSPDQGQAISPGEVARLLAPDEAASAEAAFFSATNEMTALAQAAVEAEAAFGADPGWTVIRKSFGLTGAESWFLALLLAVEIDPGLARVVAYLHDDGRLTHPTPWLAARLAGQDPAPFSGTNLRRWLLAAPLENASPERLTTAWQADPAVAHALNGVWDDPVLAGAASRIAPEAAAALPCLHPDANAALAALPDPSGTELVGPPGIGRKILAAQYAPGLSLLAVDLSKLTCPPAEALTRTLRQAMMTGALAYFDNADAVAEKDWANARALGVPFLRGVRHPTGLARPITLSPLPIAARLELWRHVSATPPPTALIAQRHTPAEILRLADGQAAEKIRPDHALLTILPTPYDWDDLILPADVTAQLRAFEDQVRLRWTVYEDWGFSRLTHLGQGIAALFGGPSGTGKTMAAQVMAKSLGIPLMRVDLAGVVSKYIGETEKNLRKVFDALEDSNALLFFDEADALFGNRTQVKDAHDRFANIEIDYLLQRIEQFNGVAILATNRRHDLDPAFVRRLRFVIEFLPPRPAERLALWRLALPECAPAGERIRDEIDFDYLAERLIMTGAEIKSTVLAAAFLARAEGAMIAMRHIFTAAQREMAKQGQRLRVPAALPDFAREAGQ
jgi:SpoVK/Ycf46/Vps4 family AAA+-type ATPase